MTEAWHEVVEPSEAPHEEAYGRPIVPSDDPFWLPPAGFERTDPGTVLRSRSVELAFLGWVPQKVTAYQLLYRTTTMDGAPQATVTTVILPEGHTADSPILSYQCAIDAIASHTFPSYMLRRYTNSRAGSPPLEYLMMATALSRGWAVLVPDHEGPEGVWGAPREPGYCVLDGVRAALDFKPAGLSADAPIGLWGYSGGGLASGWAAEMWSGYAPELNVVGAVLGSPVADLGATFRHLNGTLFSGFAAMVIAALTHRFVRFADLVREHVNEDGHKLLADLETMSTAGAVTHFAMRKVDGYLDEPLEAMLARPVLQDMFDEIRLGHHVPAMPLLMVQAVADPIISVRNIDALADTYHRGGASLTYLRDVLSEHAVLHPISTSYALRWLQDRFTDQPVPPSRTKRTALALSLEAVTGLLRLGYVSLKVVTGRSL